MLFFLIHIVYIQGEVKNTPMSKEILLFIIKS